MKKLLAVMICLSAFASSNANAWFFFFLPSRVTSAISDAVSGSEGSNCVGRNAKVGDNIRLPSSSVMTIKTLSGTSLGCTQPEFPIRALLEPSTTPTSGAASSFTSKAGIDLPDGWAPIPVTEQLKVKGYFFQALNRTIDAGLLLSAGKREGITDMLEFCKTKRTSQIAALNDGHGSEIEQLFINGLPAWRFEVSGKSKTSGSESTLLLTFIDAGTEVVDIRAYTQTAGYPSHAESLKRLAFNIKGFAASADTPSVVNEKVKASALNPPVVNEKVPPNSNDTVTTKAKLDFPNGWEQRPLSDKLKAGGNVLYSESKARETGILLATVSRVGITDVATYAATRSAAVASALQDATRSPATTFMINGASAWQVEISGKTTPRIPIIAAERSPVTILQTVYAGNDEIVVLNSWAAASNYLSQKVELKEIANSLRGIRPVIMATQNSTKSASGSDQAEAAKRLAALKSLVDKNLITKDDYETKKQSILNSM